MCAPNAPEATDAIDDEAIDSNCDGTDGDLSTAVFVRPVAGGGTLDGKDSNPGTSQLPVATVQRAVNLACASLPCKDIYLAAKPFSSNVAIQLPTAPAVAGAAPPVRIYGGFIATVVCTSTACSLQWTRGSDKTTVIREAPAKGSGDTPFGNSYAGIEAKPSTSGPLSVVLDQIRLEVHAPDPSSLLQNGESAPAQLGFVCPPRGCGQVHFRNVEVVVDPGMNGGAGTVAGATTFGGQELNGADGMPYPNVPSSNVLLLPWMHYSTTTLADTLGQMRVESFPGKGSPCLVAEDLGLTMTNNGGSPAAVRFGDSPQLAGFLGNVILSGITGDGVEGGAGGAYYVSTNLAMPQLPNTVAQRGGNGAAGTAGRFTGTFNPRVIASGQSWTFSLGLTAFKPGTGRLGSGGGGGGGCYGTTPGWEGIGDPFLPLMECPSGQTQTRGGGGGAGGCGGLRAGNGGNGGSAVGVVLAASGGNAVLTTSGTFTMNVGRGGNGGNGGRGGQGAPGGYGGIAFNVSFLAGGHGGDGGGGGGGAGGIGGSSFGIYSACASGDPATCGIILPPYLIAQPGDYVTVGVKGNAGTPGQGGAGGVKGPDTTHSRVDSTPPTPGETGAVAPDGISATTIAK
jgi:hypothetical protein